MGGGGGRIGERKPETIAEQETGHRIITNVSIIMSSYVKATRRIISLLDECLTMAQIKQVQAHLVVSSARLDPFAAGKIISVCTICNDGDIEHAYDIFLRMKNKTPFIWNTMMMGFVDRSEGARVVSLYKEMLLDRFLPNNYSFSFLLRACTELKELSLGLASHCQSIRLGWEGYDFVRNGLIHFYATCGSMESACKLFYASSKFDVVTWTAVISGYLKLGQVRVARQMFDKMPERNVVSWSAMISGYVDAELFGEALELFNDMLVSGIKPNHVAAVAALTACASLGALDQGRWVHAYLDRIRIEPDTVLGAALIDMYAKCGCIEMACSVFNKMPRRDVYAFTSLISGLSNHGKIAEALELFARMQTERVVPNTVTFICILSACSGAGLVNQGLRIFNSMREVYGIEPGVEHYGCVVDLLGRVGMLDEAKQLVGRMPIEPDAYVLGALLNACRVHGDIESGRKVVENLVNKNLDHVGVHVLLSNIFASRSQWGGVSKLRDEMKEKKVQKLPGCSFIDIDGKIQEFVVADASFEFMEEIIAILMGIENHLKFAWHDDCNDACCERD